ncbi:hypothetical protein BDW66DRAFT_146169 [Aspergillus desertorum]
MNDIHANTIKIDLPRPRMPEKMCNGGNTNYRSRSLNGRRHGPVRTSILRSTRSGAFVNENRPSPQPDTAVWRQHGL